MNGTPFWILSNESSRAHLRLFLLQLMLLVSALLGTFLNLPHSPEVLMNLAVFFVISLCAFIFALWSSTLFFQKLYDIKTTREALRHYLNLLFGLGYLKDWLSTLRAVPSGTLISHLFGQLFGFGYHYIVIKEGTLGKDYEHHPVVKVGGPAFLVIYSDSAVILERDACFSRVIGPGLVFLEPFEIIREVVDLRPQVRREQEFRVLAMTRDGIPIQVSLEVEFMIQPWTGSRGNFPDVPYPYSDRAVRGAVYNKVVGKEETYFWKDLVLYRARFELRRLLNNFVLDHLIDPEEADPHSLLDIANTSRLEMENELRQRLSTGDPNDPNSNTVKDVGVIVLRVTLGKLSIDSKFAEARDKIIEHRIERWKAEWIRRKRITEVELEAEKARLNESVRAQAQMEMLQAITRVLETQDLAKVANPSRILALRTLETLEQMALEPWAHLFMPEETLEKIRQLRSLFA